MKKVERKSIRCTLSLGIVLLVLGAQQVLAGPLPGAIFTTLEDGSRVNANIYEKREDVYLDGGPGQNAPSSAAGLPEGDYYFQVTDPSGKVLLSTDPVKCRRFHVNEYGVIDFVYPATCSQKIRGKDVETDCTHATGIDEDHWQLGAITVQLMPYDKTPNKGGVYKAWVTPVGRFVGVPELVDNPDYFHGFVPAWSKTDNYKVRRGPPPPVIRVRKFHDLNADGHWDEDPCQTEISGWQVDVTDQQLVTNTYFTPAEFIAPAGLYTLTEEIPSGWLQTALGIDGAWVPQQDISETEAIFGNVRIGSITACKFDDENANGVNNDEPPVEGFPFRLIGVNVRGEEVNEVATTGPDGCVTFADLLPGDYTVSEVLPFENWVPTTDPCVIVVLPDGDEHELIYDFGNIRLGSITACKFYDENANGVDNDEPLVEGILFLLDGTDVRGQEVHQQECTGQDGCVTFEDLYPGDYTLTEVLPSDNWIPTTEPSVSLTLAEGGELTYEFGNYCIIRKFADFNTKGYWHNKNGIAELTGKPALFAEVLGYVNSLDPYDNPSPYYSKGDEPFNGMYEDGSPVPAGKGVLEKEDIADTGTVEAEISNFLIGSVGNGGIREQLAQQLLAFIFNVRYRIDNSLDVIMLLDPQGTPVSASGLIQDAVNAWSPGNWAAQSRIANLLNRFNNKDDVRVVIISLEPCEFEPMCE
jgi:hypothetical protein